MMDVCWASIQELPNREQHSIPIENSTPRLPFSRVVTRGTSAWNHRHKVIKGNRRATKATPLLQHPKAFFLNLSDVGSPRLPKWIICAEQEVKEETKAARLQLTQVPSYLSCNSSYLIAWYSKMSKSHQCHAKIPRMAWLHRWTQLESLVSVGHDDGQPQQSRSPTVDPRLGPPTEWWS